MSERSSRVGRSDGDDILRMLTKVLAARRGGDPEASYVASLYARGLDTILKKIGEEATETVIAAKNGDRRQIVHETADLWFHSMVMLVHLGLEPDDVLTELGRRFGISGHEEKSSREIDSRRKG